MSASAQVLLIEDSRADQKLALEAFKRSKWPIRPHVMDTGQQALDFLAKKGNYRDAPVPDLIILDLNLPGTDGRVVLEKIRNELNLHNVPVVILTNSRAQEDLDKCYELCANSYVVKPDDLDEFFDIMQKIEDYWLGVSCRSFNR